MQYQDKKKKEEEEALQKYGEKMRRLNKAREIRGSMV